MLTTGSIRLQRQAAPRAITLCSMDRCRGQTDRSGGGGCHRPAHIRAGRRRRWVFRRGCPPRREGLPRKCKGKPASVLADAAFSVENNVKVAPGTSDMFAGGEFEADAAARSPMPIRAMPALFQQFEGNERRGRRWLVVQKFSGPGVGKVCDDAFDEAADDRRPPSADSWSSREHLPEFGAYSTVRVEPRRSGRQANFPIPNRGPAYLETSNPYRSISSKSWILNFIEVTG